MKPQEDDFRSELYIIERCTSEGLLWHASKQNVRKFVPESQKQQSVKAEEKKEDQRAWGVGGDRSISVRFKAVEQTHSGTTMWHRVLLRKFLTCLQFLLCEVPGDGSHHLSDPWHLLRLQDRVSQLIPPAPRREIDAPTIELYCNAWGRIGDAREKIRHKNTGALESKCTKRALLSTGGLTTDTHTQLIYRETRTELRPKWQVFICLNLHRYLRI